MQLQCRIPSAIQTFFLEKIKNKTADKAKLQKKTVRKTEKLAYLHPESEGGNKNKTRQTTKTNCYFSFWS